jgi:hypothetical protein
MYSSKGVVVVGRRMLRAKKTGFSQVIFHQGDVPSKPDMALDVASLTLDDSQASLASMPDELWRKVTSYLPPATTARAFVVASGRSSSLQKALRAEIEQTEIDLFGITRREAEQVLVPP